MSLLDHMYSNCTSLCEAVGSPHSSQEHSLCCEIRIAPHLDQYDGLRSSYKQDWRESLTTRVLSIFQDSADIGPLKIMLDKLCGGRLSVFVSVLNNSFIQVYGPPIYNQCHGNQTSVKGSKTFPQRKSVDVHTILLPGAMVADNEHREDHIGDATKATNPDSATVAGSSQSISNTRETAIVISSSENFPSSASTPQSSHSSHLPDDFKHGSSLELFSSGSTKANDNSVILVSGESINKDEEQSIWTRQDTEHKENSLSAFLYNRTRKLGNPAYKLPLPHSDNSTNTTASSTTRSLFLSHGNSDVVVGTNLTSLPICENMEVDQSTTDSTSNSCNELTGSSSDECEDFLSNKAYRLRKRKGKNVETHRNYSDMRPRQKIVKSSKKLEVRVVRRKKGFLRKVSRKKRAWGKKTNSKSFRNTKAASLLNRTKMLYSTIQLRPRGHLSQYILRRHPPTIQHARKLAAILFHSRTSRVQTLAPHCKDPEKIRLSDRQNSVIPLLKRLFCNLHKVPYHYFLHRHCPLPEGLVVSTGVQRSTAPTSHDSNDGRLPLELNNLVKAHSSHDQVFNFLRSMLLKLVPCELFGSVHNRAVFFTHLRRFVEQRRWETLSVRQICRGIKLSHCTWLKLTPLKHRGRPYPPQPHLFEKFICWLMEEVVIKMLRVFFYITEHSEHNNRLFYYRKEVWSQIEEQAIRMVIPYKKISVEEVRKHFHFGQTLGISKIRFLPKTNGVRVIVNFGSRLKFLEQPQLLRTVNEQLKHVFYVLNYEKNSRPQLVGSSCFGLNDVFLKLKKFSREQKSCDPEKEGPLLFVRVDISSCYDSIIAEKILDIMAQLLTKRCYLIRRYAKVFLSQNKIRRTFLKAAAPKYNCPTFFNFAKKEAKTSSNCIFVDQGHHIEISKEKVELLLRKHLHGNIVKLGRDYYKQVRGIAHGAQLSTLLCGFYYADMERTCLPKIDPDKGLLMRYVDDFILITRERDVARQFLDTMQRGVAEYNCTINPAKTVTNFRVREDGELECLEDVEWISWCGVLLNTKTLDVRTDFSKYTEKNIHDNMTISLHGKHFSYLRSFSRRVVKLRCLPIFLDARVVSDKNMMINMYQGFLIASYKYLTVLLSMPNAKKMAYPKQRGGFTRRELLFFFKTAVQMFTYFWHLTKNKGIRNPLLGKDLCVWLGCHSLREVLTQHQPNKLVFLIRLLSYKIYALSNILGVDMIRMFFSATKWHRSKSIFTVTV